MIRFISILIFFCVFISCKNENRSKLDDFRDELRPYLQRLSKEKKVPVSDTVARNILNKKATKEELIKLMNFEKPLLRVISYREIVNRGETEYFDLLLNHLNDKDKVTWEYYEDAGGSFTVSDLMILKAHDKNGLSPIQKKVLVEKVLLEHPYLEVSDEMIRDIDPDEKFYKLIKDRAQGNNEKCGIQLGAAFALSKFKKKEDVDLLYNLFNKSINRNPCGSFIFKSIERFPDEKFFPLLKMYFEKQVKDQLSPKLNITEEMLFFLRAVAAYKNKEALEILQYIEKNNTYINKGYWPPSNKKYVLKAIHFHYDKIYDELLIKIKNELSECDQKNLTYKYEYDERKEW
ncbi:hypothetical protein [Chryseobacterium sp. MYb328]|uniref:hypothetical protein n=1 Tax=Chryseobacterium sp. MYb328 TaxID=2745231 RepID=UPI0030B4FD96